MSIEFLCPVRRCQRPLCRDGRSFACPRGHSFDVARSGYINLSQPQDKKSKNAGDSAEAVQARRRLNDRGLEGGLAGVLGETVRGLALPVHPAILDVGCGEGFHLAGLYAAIGGEAVGVDLSTTAIELAAKRYPAISWMVANADRQLPFGPGSFDLILSITARHNPAEYRRLLAHGGHLMVVIPGSDDLIELREAILGESSDRDRTGATVATYEPFFELRSRKTFRERRKLDRATLLDLLASTYRGGRKSQKERVVALGDLEVTMSRDILVFGESKAEVTTQNCGHQKKR